MSTKMRLRGSKPEPIDPAYLPAVAAMRPRINRMADRHDLVFTVRDRLPAPAIFHTTHASVELNRSQIAHLDPAVLRSADFAKKYPSLFGALVHEACHAAKSRWDLERIYRRFGKEHYDVFAMLEEARCERDNAGNLLPIEAAGLKACLLEIVLRDVTAEDAETANAARLVGLMAGRVDHGTITLADPRLDALVAKITDLLGPSFRIYWDLAVEFSRVRWEGGWSNNEDLLHGIVKRWLAVDAPESGDEGDEGGDEGGDESDESDEAGDQSGAGQPGEDEGDEGDEGEGEGSGLNDDGEDADGEGDEPGSGGQPGEDEGDESESGDQGGEPGDGDQQDGQPVNGDDAGLGDDGDNDIDQTHEVQPHQGEDHLGNYDDGHFETADVSLDDLLSDLGVTAEEVKREVLTTEVGPAVRAEHTASARAHSERRQRNKEAQKLWK